MCMLLASVPIYPLWLVNVGICDNPEICSGSSCRAPQGENRCGDKCQATYIYTNTILPFLTLRSVYTWALHLFCIWVFGIKFSDIKSCCLISIYMHIVLFHCFNSLRPSEAYMHQWNNHHWLRWRLVAWSTPGHYLNQWWNIVNWTLRNNLQCNFILNSNICIQQNALENVLCEMAPI